MDIKFSMEKKVCKLTTKRINLKKITLKLEKSMTYTKVVIIGGGFGGLNAAKTLKNASVDILLLDKTNHHLFQPLLYQVATAALSPGDRLSDKRNLPETKKHHGDHGGSCLH